MQTQAAKAGEKPDTPPDELMPLMQAAFKSGRKLKTQRAYIKQLEADYNRTHERAMRELSLYELEYATAAKALEDSVAWS